MSNAWLLLETIRAYSGLDDESLRILQAAYPHDPIRQTAIAAVFAVRETPDVARKADADER